MNCELVVRINHVIRFPTKFIVNDIYFRKISSATLVDFYRFFLIHSVYSSAVFNRTWSSRHRSLGGEFQKRLYFRVHYIWHYLL